MIARHLRRQDVFLGAALLLLGLAVGAETTQITTGFSYDTVGPRAIPYIVAAGLVMSGLFITIIGATSTTEDRQERSERTDWIAVVIISVALLMQMLVMEMIGWIPSATIAFAAVARAFGNRQVLLNLLFGFLLASGTFALFTYGLGLRLPLGRIF
jgi:putative tricarboxylic transport membrane protein